MDTLDQEFLNDLRDIPDVLGGTDSTLPMDGAQPTASVQPSAMLTPETLEVTFGMAFDMAAEMSGEGGEFWRLKEVQKRELAKAWLPVVGPLLDKMGESQTLAIFTAAGCTMMVLVPRVQKEKAKRRASKTATTETASSGASPSSQVPQAAESLMKPTDLLPNLGGA